MDRVCNLSKSLSSFNTSLFLETRNKKPIPFKSLFNLLSRLYSFLIDLIVSSLLPSQGLSLSFLMFVSFILFVKCLDSCSLQAASSLVLTCLSSHMSIAVVVTCKVLYSSVSIAVISSKFVVESFKIQMDRQRQLLFVLGD